MRQMEGEGYLCSLFSAVATSPEPQVPETLLIKVQGTQEETQIQLAPQWHHCPLLLCTRWDH